MNTWENFDKLLTEGWESIQLNFPRIAVALGLLLLFTIIASVVGGFFSRRMKQRGTDSIMIAFSIRLARFVFVVIGLMLALQILGFTGIAGGILAGAGMGAIVIGFAFKEIGENFLAGIILVFDRPFNAGDTVTINDMMGVVVGLKFRTTHLKSFDGKDIYVPNGAVIRNNVYNFTQDGLLRQEFVIGIDYEDDLEDAIRLISGTVTSHADVLTTEETHVIVDEFTTNTVNLRIMFWINTTDYRIGALLTKSQVMAAVKKALLESKFGLPANIQEIKMYRPDPLPIVLADSASKQKE
jgi:small conductance mechanosensitive channel